MELKTKLIILTYILYLSQCQVDYVGFSSREEGEKACSCQAKHSLQLRSLNLDSIRRYDPTFTESNLRNVVCSKTTDGCQCVYHQVCTGVPYCHGCPARCNGEGWECSRPVCVNGYVDNTTCQCVCRKSMPCGEYRLSDCSCALRPTLRSHSEVQTVHCDTSTNSWVSGISEINQPIKLTSIGQQTTFKLLSVKLKNKVELTLSDTVSGGSKKLTLEKLYANITYTELTNDKILVTKVDLLDFMGTIGTESLTVITKLDHYPEVSPPYVKAILTYNNLELTFEYDKTNRKITKVSATYTDTASGNMYSGDVSSGVDSMFTIIITDVPTVSSQKLPVKTLSVIVRDGSDLIYNASGTILGEVNYVGKMVEKISTGPATVTTVLNGVSHNVKTNSIVVEGLIFEMVQFACELSVNVTLLSGFVHFVNLTGTMSIKGDVLLLLLSYDLEVTKGDTTSRSLIPLVELISRTVSENCVYQPIVETETDKPCEVRTGYHCISLDSLSKPDHGFYTTSKGFPQHLCGGCNTNELCVSCEGLIVSYKDDGRILKRCIR